MLSRINFLFVSLPNLAWVYLWDHWLYAPVPLSRLRSLFVRVREPEARFLLPAPDSSFASVNFLRASYKPYNVAAARTVLAIDLPACSFLLLAGPVRRRVRRTRRPLVARRFRAYFTIPALSYYDKTYYVCHANLQQGHAVLQQPPTRYHPAIYTREYMVFANINALRMRV